MSVKDRLERVQYRSMQADSALKQLETCIDVINSKKSKLKSIFFYDQDILLWNISAQGRSTVTVVS